MNNAIIQTPDIFVRRPGETVLDLSSFVVLGSEQYKELYADIKEIDSAQLVGAVVRQKIKEWQMISELCIAVQGRANALKRRS